MGTMSDVISWLQINEARELLPTVSYLLAKGHSMQRAYKYHGFKLHSQERKKPMLSQSCAHFWYKKKPS